MDFLLALDKKELKKIFPTVKEVREGLVKRDIDLMKKELQEIKGMEVYNNL